MLSKKTVVFLAALLALLAGADRLAGRFLPKGGPVGLPPAVLLPQADGAAFSAVAVTNGAAAVRAVRSQDGLWRLVEPADARADAAGVSLLVDTVVRARVLDRVTARQRAARGLSAADFGFEPPRASVVLERAGARPVLVEFGADTPDGEGVFARVDGSDAFLAVERVALDGLPASADALRDRVLFVPPGRTPVSLSIRGRGRAEGEVRLEAGPGGAWEIAAPYRCAAAPTAVEPLLRSLSFSVAERFVPAREAVDAGLAPDETDLLLSLRLDGEARDRDFAFGKPDPSAPGGVYVAALADGACATVDRTVSDALRMPLDVLREHRVLPFGADDLRSLSFESSAGVFELAREDGPGSPWAIRRPSPQPADPAAAAAFLDALLAMRDVGAEPAPADAPPALSAVTLSLEPFPPRQPEKFVLARLPGPAGTGTVFAVDAPARALRRFADPETAPAAAFDPAALASLRSRTVVSIPADALPGASPALAALLVDFRARAVAALFVPDSAVYGLMPPRREIAVRTTLPDRPVVIFQLGSALPDGGAWLRVKGDGEVFEIGPDEAAVLSAEAP
ncbi:MAG: DUF4340 domain-containing protein [Kiritimatiellae bacterium]|nr:DUF4340 domain-containing protein [Kiritimatiellia bacterium]